MRVGKILLSMGAMAAIVLTGVNAAAQAKRVQMHIAGYLCGN